MLSRFVIAFLPRSKGVVISWLQSPPVVTLDCFPLFPFCSALGKEMATHSGILAWRTLWTV